MKPQEIQLSLFSQDEMGPALKGQHVINVASVPQRSPFRYPGGKTWLVPTARKWFSQIQFGAHLVEPFAGGGIISLTAAAEHYFENVTMIELDSDMAAAWQTILSDDCKWLTNQISNFKVTTDNINDVIAHSNDGVKELAFSTIVRNRTNHGGILARGSGLIKTGENGKGLGSRWYPATLIKRITEVNKMRERITFIQGDAFEYMVTYDDTSEVRGWAEEFNLPYITIPMQTTHLVTKEELLISDNFEWYGINELKHEHESAKSLCIV